MNTTKQATHTPGPWRVGHFENNGRAIYADNGKPEIVGWSKENNSAIIANAPELLKALKDLREVIVEFNQQQKSTIEFLGGWSIHDADKVIAKAEGRA